ncbi:MAG: class I SAM-dependent methyltransferase [Desulfocucumaceae bacterium]
MAEIDESRIIEEVKRKGRVTFSEYMSLALYHPEEGYYMGSREKIGAGGDFYTSPDVSPLFGMALADQLKEMWRVAGRPEKWTLLEMGAGKGNLAGVILQHLAEKYPEFHRALNYLIIEKSPSMKGLQEKTLFGTVKPGHGIGWLGGLEELSPGSLCGCVFSNELLDAFPVHRVTNVSGALKEIYVSFERGGLKESVGTLSLQELQGYVDQFNIELEEGQSIEINLALRDWLRGVARAMKRGFVMTIDYGDTASRLYSDGRQGGTIRSYSRHRLVDDLYSEPGRQDITANVNFTALIKWGEEEGLPEAGYVSQANFLMNMGILDYLKPPAPGEGFDPEYSKNMLAVKKLIMPEGMGAVFKVAAQYRGFDIKPALRGFQRRLSRR